MMRFLLAPNHDKRPPSAHALEKVLHEVLSPLRIRKRWELFFWGLASLFTGLSAGLVATWLFSAGGFSPWAAPHAAEWLWYAICLLTLFAWGLIAGALRTLWLQASSLAQGVAYLKAFYPSLAERVVTALALVSPASCGRNDRYSLPLANAFVEQVSEELRAKQDDIASKVALLTTSSLRLAAFIMGGAVVLFLVLALLMRSALVPLLFPWEISEEAGEQVVIRSLVERFEVRAEIPWQDRRSKGDAPPLSRETFSFDDIRSQSNRLIVKPDKELEVVVIPEPWIRDRLALDSPLAPLGESGSASPSFQDKEHKGDEGKQRGMGEVVERKGSGSLVLGVSDPSKPGSIRWVAFQREETEEGRYWAASFRPEGLQSLSLEWCPDNATAQRLRYRDYRSFDVDPQAPPLAALSWIEPSDKRVTLPRDASVSLHLEVVGPVADLTTSIFVMLPDGRVHQVPLDPPPYEATATRCDLRTLLELSAYDLKPYDSLLVWAEVTPRMSPPQLAGSSVVFDPLEASLERTKGPRLRLQIEGPESPYRRLQQQQSTLTDHCIAALADFLELSDGNLSDALKANQALERCIKGIRHVYQAKPSKWQELEPYLESFFPVLLASLEPVYQRNTSFFASFTQDSGKKGEKGDKKGKKGKKGDLQPGSMTQEAGVAAAFKQRVQKTISVLEEVVLRLHEELVSQQVRLSNRVLQALGEEWSNLQQELLQGLESGELVELREKLPSLGRRLEVQIESIEARKRFQNAFRSMLEAVEGEQREQAKELLAAISEDFGRLAQHGFELAQGSETALWKEYREKGERIAAELERLRGGEEELVERTRNVIEKGSLLGVTTGTRAELATDLGTPTSSTPPPLDRGRGGSRGGRGGIPTQRLSPSLRNEVERLVRRQREVAAELSQVSQLFGVIDRGSQGDLTGDAKAPILKTSSAAGEAVSRAQDAMQSAVVAFRDADLEGALTEQRRAVASLQDAKEGVLRRVGEGSREDLLEEAGEDPSRFRREAIREAGNSTGNSTEDRDEVVGLGSRSQSQKVEFRGDRRSDRVREEVLKQMKERRLDGYQEQIQNYYEQLLQ